MDHRELLKKYMQHIFRMEGGDYLGFTAVAHFSPEEYEELCKLTDENNYDNI